MGFRHKGVDQCRFAHAGLADENAGLARQMRSQRVGIGAGRKPKDRVTQSGKRRQHSFGARQEAGEVTFVEHDQRLQVLAFRGDEAAGDQFVRERRLGGDDDDDLCDIGGDQLLPECIRAIQQGTTRLDAVDHALIIAAALDGDVITTGDFAFLAAREAGDDFTVGQFHPVLPPVGGDDCALLAHDDEVASREIRSAAGGWES